MAGVETATNSSVVTEIADLKSHATCKIIRNVGEFTHVINATIPNSDVVVKFQLTADYPATKPTVFLRHPSLSKDVIQKFITASLSAGSLAEIFVNIRDNLTACNHLNTKGKASPGSSKRNKKKSGSPTPSEKTPSKKPSMKTAAAVVKRIQWDPELESEKFVVGYIDRFTGIQEQPFNTFNWVNPAEAEWDDLNIPEHRIEYFRYEEHIVWEKKSRTDNMFGSTGGVTIDQFIANLSLNGGDAAGATGNNEVTPIVINADDSDDDDDVDISFGSIVTANPLQGAGRKITTPPAPSNVTKHNKPNHFIALPVTNPAVVQAACQAQQQYSELSELDVDRFATEEHNFHITLCAVRIDTDDDLDTVNQILYETVLDQSAKINRSYKFHGLDTFFSRVLFAKAEFDERFHKFVIHIRRELKQAGITIFDNDSEFVPHMTLLKFPKYAGVSFLPVEDFFKLRGGNRFDACEELPLGRVTLLSMERDSDNKYIEKFSVDFE